MYEGYENKDEVVQLYLDDIIPNRFQPREVFDEKALKELAVSIKEHGVIQPIIVRSVNGKYEIIAGERRYKASALAGLTKIPAIVRNLDDKESSKVALLENLQRKNLNPIEEARTYQKILELDQMTQDELAKTMGKSQSSVANKIRLLSLPDDIQEAILKEQISERHARALLSVDDTKVQKELMNKVIEEKMSVRSLEEEIEKKYPKGKSATDIPIDNNATTGEFLDLTPLSPTAGAIQEEVTNYGKVVIAPPKEEGEEQQAKEADDSVINPNKFVNYGEIGKEEDDGTTGMGGQLIPTTNQTIDVHEERKNSTDIKPASGGAALDNLLNINTSESAPLSKEEKAQKEDYFSLPEIPSIKIEDDDSDSGSSAITNPLIPMSSEHDSNISSPLIPTIGNEGTESSPLIPTIAGESTDTETLTTGDAYSLEEATKKIVDLVEDLQEHGVKIHKDEMDFPKSYQVIIKIDKE